VALVCDLRDRLFGELAKTRLDAATRRGEAAVDEFRSCPWRGSSISTISLVGMFGRVPSPEQKISWFFDA
jgi:hypothetical protein